MWETLHNNAGWDCFKTLTLPEILKTQNRPQREFWAYLEVTRLFTQDACARNKPQCHTVLQKLKSFLLMQVCAWGTPALDLWDLVIEVLHSSSNQTKKSKNNVQGNLLHDTPSKKRTKKQAKTPIQYNDLESCNVDYVASNVKSSQFCAMLYILKDNEAVIKMIIKGRSPTMRHVSRTHKVELDWLFDRSNLNPKIQITYVDTKNQLADTLTKGNFTRDEWNNLLDLFTISIFSSASCPEAMSKRMQQGTREERIVAKSTLNLVSHTAASSLTPPSSSASSRPGILRTPTQQGSNLTAQCAWKPAAGGSNQNDATSGSQMWLTNAKMSERARKLAAVDTNLDQSFQERARKLATENFDINDEDDSKWPHSLRISRAVVPHLEKVHANLRQQLKRKARRQNGGPRSEHVDVENVYDCLPTSRSSSW